MQDFLEYAFFAAALYFAVTYFLRKRAANSLGTDKIPAEPPHAPVAGTPGGAVSPTAAPVERRSVVTEKAPGTAANETAFPIIPQDSVLKRHYLAHIKSLIEELSFPRPTDSVLLRHYEQLIASELDKTLSDEAKIAGLLRQYDELRASA